MKTPRTLRQIDARQFAGEGHFVHWKKLTPEAGDYGYRVTNIRTGEQLDLRTSIEAVARVCGYDTIQTIDLDREYKRARAAGYPGRVLQP